MLIIDHAEIERNTQTKDHISHLLALLVFSSSHQETKYIIPLIISATTATTATYFITSAVRLDTNHSTAFLSEFHSQPGNQVHSHIFGATE